MAHQHGLDNADADTLLRHADQTMYQAKMSGRNTFKLFNPAHNRQTMEKQQWQQQIRQALNEQQFCLTQSVYRRLAHLI